LVFISLVRPSGGEIRDGVWMQRLCLGMLFALGAAVGYIYALSSAEGTVADLTVYLDDYCRLFSQGEAGMFSLGAAVFLYYGSLFLVFFSGFTPFGAFIIPTVLALFGFSAMYACACFAMVYGRGGVILAAATLGIRLVFTLPCLLWVGSHAWATASSRFSPGKGKRCVPVLCSGSDWYRFLVCVILLLIGICVDRYVTFALFQRALQAL